MGVVAVASTCPPGLLELGLFGDLRETSAVRQDEANRTTLAQAGMRLSSDLSMSRGGSATLGWILIFSFLASIAMIGILGLAEAWFLGAVVLHIASVLAYQAHRESTPEGRREIEPLGFRPPDER